MQHGVIRETENSGNTLECLGWWPGGPRDRGIRICFRKGRETLVRMLHTGMHMQETVDFRYVYIGRSPGYLKHKQD